MDSYVDFYLHKSDGIVVTQEKYYFDQILIEQYSLKISAHPFVLHLSPVSTYSL